MASFRAPALSKARGGVSSTIVIKLGTSSIVHETTHQPLLSTLSSVVETVVKLREQGHKVVLVSSGAIGVGLKRMNIPVRPKSLSGKQALAAIGQGRLIALWDNLFGQFEQPIAQVLLTRGDISERTRYLNAVNTFKELLSMGVVPIVNENDTVSVSEIKFGDNDTLSAITSSMIHADYLFLLTDVDGLYTSNPRKDPAARMIEVVESVSDIRSQVSTTTLGSSLGTGGMETKLIAAEIATGAGVTTIITSSKNPENIFKIIEYHSSTRVVIPNPGPSAPEATEVAPPSDQIPATEHSQSQLKPLSIDVPSIILVRPPHTVFTPSPTPLRDLKSWTRHTLSPSGSVIIDGGAHNVLNRRESGGRLLAAGVVGVLGAFASGQAVRIVIRSTIGVGGKGITAEEEKASYARALEATRPSTPATGELGTPAAQIPESSSSILGDLLSQQSSLSDDGAATATEPPLPSPSNVGPESGRRDSLAETDVIEVGRGLANYNSAQIEKVKGLNSSNITQLLGYADSEYVVENITIRIPPSTTA
ncbi:glutamate 5-kinase [Pluteus cervinus]|uniref:Glutamate 5-kinase n=1 Tax=Pluteus cervinus TaxID=181527 RepID=A0ACD3AJL7_9AGAR|nr:glutamate 5-kinase [Pluteus cervinus]